MRAFDPTIAPRGRLARLGVVLDVAKPVDRIRGLAILCDRAGIDAVWLLDRARLDRPEGWRDPSDAAAVVSTALGRARLGVGLGSGGVATGDRPGPMSARPAAQELLLAPESIQGHDRDREADRPTPRGTRPRLSTLVDDLASLRPMFAVADDIVLPAWRFPDLETAADEVRAEAGEAGRDPATLGVGALVTVSIGRTRAEAEARADADPLFGRLGHPDETGIFGTLEECQDRVIALAHAGISDLLCILPATADLHDVIAQLTAMTVGTTEVLIPGFLRSPAPPPPEGWGGRPDVPISPQVSGGSRRR